MTTDDVPSPSRSPGAAGPGEFHEPDARTPPSLDQVRSRLARHPEAIIPFLVLMGVTLAVAVVFFVLVRSYLLALFGAAMMGLVATPLHEGLAKRLGNSRHIAAGLITLTVVVVVVVPLVFGVAFGVRQLDDGVRYVQERINQRAPEIEDWLKSIDDRLHISKEEMKTHAEELSKTLVSTALTYTQGVVGGILHILVQLLVFVIAFHFFLVDQHRLSAAWERMTPLDLEHDRFIRTQFTKVCRGAMWGTVLAALAQGVAIAVGFFVIDLFAHTGMGRWALLFGILASVVAVVPFIGTAAVWVPTAVVLFLQEHTLAAVAVVVYGLAVVGTIDNLIKIIVIKDAANLHPLLVLICAFGGLQVMGILGIFLGPAVGAIVFALMQTLRNELNSLTEPSPATIPPR